jgi:DNA-binding MarR family transcriptional regulator
MSIKLMSMIWADRSGLLSPTETSILIRMADFGADDGSSIYPGITRLTEDCKVSRTSVKDALRSLKEKGFLIVAQEAVKRLHKATVYRINVEYLTELSKKNDVVDKIKKQPPPRAPADPGARPGAALGARAPADPQPLLTTVIKNQQQLSKRTDLKLEAPLGIKPNEDHVVVLDFLEKEAKFLKSAAVDLVEQYGIPRLKVVIRGLESTKSPVSNFGAWILKALRQGWEFPEPQKRTEKPIETRSHHARQNIPSLAESRAWCDAVDEHQARVDHDRKMRELLGEGPRTLSAIMQNLSTSSQTMSAGEIR